MTTVKNALLALLTLAATVWVLYTNIPHLANDMVINDWVAAPSLKIEEAKCTVYTFVVSTCDITYSDRQNPGAKPASLAYLVYGSWGDESFGLWRSASRPEIVSTSFAIRDLNARILMMVLWIAIVLTLCFVIVQSFFWGGGVAEHADPSEVVAAQPVRTTGQVPTGTRTEFGRRSRGP